MKLLYSYAAVIKFISNIITIKYNSQAWRKIYMAILFCCSCSFWLYIQTSVGSESLFEVVLRLLAGCSGFKGDMAQYTP
jgi:hypothetical protein